MGALVVVLVEVVLGVVVVVLAVVLVLLLVAPRTRHPREVSGPVEVEAGMKEVAEL
jgi:hypothetical protein